MNTLLQWILTIGSVVMLWTMGNKWKYAPFLGLANQVVWIAYFIITKQYILLIGALLYTVVHARNAIKWIRTIK